MCRRWRQGATGAQESVLIMLAAADHPAPASLDRLTHGYALRDELEAAWAVRPLALVRENGRTVLELEDPGGEPLARQLGAPMEIGRFLRLAIDIAAAVGRLHQHGLIHKDLKPANILVDCADGRVRLTGFGIASRLPRERQPPEPPEFIAGTLAYMAPEQTGRMNRSIDARSDLYALGVTLYQMLTGYLPFTASDPMEWVHCHIARRPVPPAGRLENVPPAVSAIILKLLSKTAEERYQTATGVERDLRRCLADWDAGVRMTDFPLGEHDTPDRLMIPEKLYGRQHEIEILLAAFDRVVAGGRPELVLVSGYSGIGKSAVVNEVHKVLVLPRGLFASGKFDQYKRDIPYATLVQAFQSLIRPLLGKSDAELAGWRDALREALDPNGRLMIEFVPELKLLIGEQSPVPELPPQQAQSRLQLMFRRFLGVFARPEHPLTLFLDDLQWLDAATPDVLFDLLTQADVQHVLVIGAYRDNEVDSAHPLVRKLDAMRKAGALVQEISLAPLAEADLGRFIADTLSCTPGHAAPLAHLAQEKTGGNPFFAIQFISELAEEGLLRFDHGAARWCWDLDRIHAKGYTDNVVDLMVGKLSRLPTQTQTALQLLACLGNAAEAGTLCRIRGTSEQAVHADLWEAVRQELILRLEGAYKFVHDRVQEAAYALIPAESRAAAHLRIGRLLSAQTPPEKREEAIFEIVNQLNRGTALITAPDEREQLAELNLIAGKRATLSTAYASALTYFITGAALSAEDAWDRRHELAFALELHRGECEFLTGALAEAEQRLAALSDRAADTVERATVTCLRVDLYTTLGQAGRAIAVSLDYLLRLGTNWPPHPTEEDVRHEYKQIWLQLGGREIEELIELPLMNDAASLATLDVLTKVMAPAMFTDANLASLVICRAVSLSLERGNCDGSCFAYVMLGLVAGAQFGDYQAAFRFGQLGYDLVEKRGLKRFQARIYTNIIAVVLLWTRHVRAGGDMARRAFDTAMKMGDLTYAAYATYVLISNLLAAGDPLVEVQREAEAGLAFAQKMQFGFAIDIIATQLALVRMLRGLTPAFGSLDDEQFNELAMERRLSRSPDLARVECWFWIRKLQARFLAGDYGAAVDAKSKAQRLIWTSPTQYETVDYHFYGALSLAASCHLVAADESAPHAEALASHHRQLEIWAANCPENFENRAALVGAEIARLEGRELDAERLYEQAIRSAHANGFMHNEALANELAARFYATRGFDKIALTYLRDARYLYLRWGAGGKVRQLDRLYPHVAVEERRPGPTGMIEAPVEHLDLGTVIKLSQAVSGEIVLEKLLETLMRTAIEYAGADRASLILYQGTEQRVAAEAAITGQTVSVHLQDEPVSAARLPESVIHYVARTGEVVLLDEASAENPFSDDPYISHEHPRSVLCLPLMNEARLTGLLYLENRATSRVFTPGRIAVLKLLASQAAISLENARLHTALMHENRDRQQAEEALRASEGRWRSLFENVPVGVMLLGPDDRYVAVNRAFQDMVGFSEAELCDRSPIEITHEDDRIGTQAILAARAVGDATAFRREKRYKRKDGGIIWADVSSFMVPVMGGAPLEAVFAIDITDRKQAEEALRRSRAFLIQGQEISRTGSWYWNVTTGEVRWSPEHYRIFGYDPETTRPSYDIFTERVHPEDRPLLDQTVARSAAEKSQFQREYRVVLPDGSVKHLLSIGRPGVAGSGDLEYVGTVMDITERKRAEAQARESERRYRGMETELAHANRLATMGQLTASIAHEINQPIAASVTNAQAALRWLRRQPPDLEEARRTLGRIVDNGRRAGDVIDRIRALIKKAPSQRHSLEMNGAIREVVELTHGEAVKNGVSVRTNLADGLPLIEGDRVQLQQVILNLVINAIQAVAAVADGVREVLIATGQGEPYGVLVAISDSGPGLEPADLERLFEPFYTTKQGGLGMGLSICQSIVAAHGGRLWADANLPRGAIFQFTVPVSPGGAS
ncbi:MAG TPA: AAA family ATPase [Acetobacteraceae bacterium]|nr:AAA family ATPase [Acetobacteraceae bacterium]